MKIRERGPERVGDLSEEERREYEELSIQSEMERFRAQYKEWPRLPENYEEPTRSYLPPSAGPDREDAMEQ